MPTDPREITIKSWEELHDFHHTMHDGYWFFRGAACKNWKLLSSFDRICEKLGFPSDERAGLERRILTEFQRSYHLYAPNPPRSEHGLEWRSIMQHHGAPTRLLDFSYSIYTATYFALEKMSPCEYCEVSKGVWNETDSVAVVWCIEAKWAEKTAREALLKGATTGKKASIEKKLSQLQVRPFTQNRYEVENELVIESKKDFVFPLTPFHLNQRLRTQSGSFLVPGNVGVTFQENLDKMAGSTDVRHVKKLLIPFNLRRDFLKKLFDVNCSRTTLFPGLDGFAETLGVYSPALDSKDYTS
jgi:hypothetical protein